MYQLKIIEITPRNHFALFERSDEEYGWLEMLIGDVEVGDVLREIRNRDFLKCGHMECMLGSYKVKIHINDFGFEKDMRKDVYLYDERI